MPSLTTGDEWPTPTVTFHSSFKDFGQLGGAESPLTFPSRFGPRHCGQFAATAAGVAGAAASGARGVSVVRVDAALSGVVDGTADGAGVETVDDDGAEMVEAELVVVWSDGGGAHPAAPSVIVTNKIKLVASNIFILFPSSRRAKFLS